MVHWVKRQLEAIENYKKLEDVPVEEREYKCYGEKCYVTLKKSDLLPDGSCPICKSKSDLVQMCPADNPEGCSGHTVVSGFEVCPICGEFVCPECGSHDVEVASRVTGYLSSVKNWAAGKLQEFMDRKRHTVTL